VKQYRDVAARRAPADDMVARRVRELLHIFSIRFELPVPVSVATLEWRGQVENGGTVEGYRQGPTEEGVRSARYLTASSRGRDRRSGWGGVGRLLVVVVSDTFRGPPPTGGYLHVPARR